MNVKSQKKMAARILKVGVSRIKITQTKELGDAITRNDIRKLIVKGIIKKEKKKGQARAQLKKRMEQKKKGRRSGQGSRKGKAYAKKTSKELWIERVRPLRRLLRQLRDTGKIEKSVYRKIYKMIKGGSFRSKKHMLYYLKENELLAKTKKGET